MKHHFNGKLHQGNGERRVEGAEWSLVRWIGQYVKATFVAGVQVRKQK